MRNNLSILSLNIHGATSKLEQSNLLHKLNQYDIVYLSEVKHTYPLSIPGYTCVRSRTVDGEELRGGVAILFKSQIWPEVHNLFCEYDQIWFKLHSIPHVKFGAIYIPPRDSPYFNPHSFALIQEHTTNENVFIIGDFNSRMGNLDTLNQPTENMNYNENPDVTTNANGRDVMSLCMSQNITPVNHLQYNNVSFDGKRTFRKQQRWISQLDWALCSISLIKYIDSFSIHQDMNLPTDHASLSLHLSGFTPTPSHLLSCSKQLGVYESTPQQPTYPRRPISSKCIDHTSLVNNLHMPNYEEAHTDINTLCEELALNIYTAAKTASIKPMKTQHRTPQH